MFSFLIIAMVCPEAVSARNLESESEHFGIPGGKFHVDGKNPDFLLWVKRTLREILDSSALYVLSVLFMTTVT